MKIFSILTLAAVTASLGVPQSARAGDKERAIIGGLIGGIIIGSALSDDRADTRVHVSHRSGHRHHRDSGYWKWVTVKTWMPGYYERSCDRWGNPRRIWVSGHYKYRKQRVWVTYDEACHDRHYSRDCRHGDRCETRYRSADGREYRRHEDRDSRHWRDERREHSREDWSDLGSRHRWQGEGKTKSKTQQARSF